MKKETGVEIYSLAMDAIKSLSMILNILPQDTPSDELYAIKRGIGKALGDIQIHLLNLVSAQYPELDDLKD